MKVVGMISGTSFDGIDAGCFDINVVDGVMSAKILGFESYEYKQDVHDLIAKAMPPQTTDLESI